MAHKLLDISLEIREHIWEFVVQSWDEDETIFGRPCISMEESRLVNATLPLFQVNRQVRFEAMNTYYRSISVSICRDVGNNHMSGEEAQAVRNWLNSFTSNIGCLRLLVLKAITFADPSESMSSDDSYWWNPHGYDHLWRYRCHLDMAGGSLKYSISRGRGTAFSKDQRQRVRENMAKTLKCIHSKREEGKLSQQHLQLLFDTYYSHLLKNIKGYVSIHPSLRSENSLALDALPGSNST